MPFLSFAVSFVRTLIQPRSIKIMLLILCAISALAAIGFSYAYYSKRNHMITKAMRKGERETKKAAQEIEKFLGILPPLVSTMANNLTASRLDKDKILAAIQKKPMDVTGIGILFAPYQYEATKKLYAPYFVEKDGAEKLVQLEDLGDYTNQDRYTIPMAKGPIFLEPFLDKTSNATLAEFSAPFYDAKHNPIGVVFANQSTEHIQHVLLGVDLGRSGYGIIMSKLGKLVAHPNETYVKQGKTFLDLVEPEHDMALENIIKQALQGKAGYIEHIDESTGQQYWIFFEPMPSVGWTLIGVFLKDELKLETKTSRRLFINMILCIMAFFTLLGLLLVKVYNGNAQEGIKRLWLGSIILSAGLLSCILLIWYMAFIDTHFYLRNEQKDTFVSQDRTALVQFLNSLGKDEQGSPGNHESHGDHSTTTPTSTSTATPASSPISITTKTQVHQHIDTTGSVQTTLASKYPRIERPSTQKSYISYQKQITPAPPQNTPTIAVAQPTAMPEPSAQFPKQATAPSTTINNATSTRAHAGHEDQHESAIMAGAAHKHAAHMHIPTGFYIDQLRFKDTDQIEIVAHVWQKYFKGVQDSIQRGITFPQATESTIKEIYRFSHADGETIGWSVRCILKQTFSYVNYPFDRQTVRIQLWPNDFDKGVILVPDLPSYQIISPSFLPGINPNIVLQGWHLEKSYFSYKFNKYPTNFGYYAEGPFGTIQTFTKSQTPELYFNVILERYIISSLILSLLPIFIVAMLLFILLAMTGLIELKFETILGSIGTLFFTVIISHTKFKSDLPVQELVFFEYFYYLLQIILLVVTGVTIAYYLKVNTRLIQYGNLLIPSLFYWPLFLIAVLSMSMIYFY